MTAIFYLRQEFLSQRNNLNKRVHHDEDEGNDSDDSDENQKEIDYPDEESEHDRDDEGDGDGDERNADGEENEGEGEGEDDERNADGEEDEDDDMTRNIRHVFNPYTEDSEDLDMTLPNSSAACCICQENVPVFKHRMDELDHVVTTVPSLVLLQNPCQQHYTCVSCIKTTLVNNALALFKDGNGHFPCQGDSHCVNARGQRTTTFLYQLRELFTDTEWQPIVRALHLYRLSQGKVDNPHPYFVPLTPKDQLHGPALYRHMCQLMDQDHPRVQCPICAVTIQKTTACFAIRHCDWEVCWMCARVERRLDTNHWKTCPRYDSNPFWKSHGYNCTEGTCFDEDRMCENVHHSHGRQSMDSIRKSYQVQRFFASLTLNQQNEIIHHLQQDGRWESYQHHLARYNACPL
jgi:hypothetical protein